MGEIGARFSYCTVIGIQGCDTCMLSGKSDIIIKNNKGERTLPFGVPISMINVLEVRQLRADSDLCSSFF